MKKSTLIAIIVVIAVIIVVGAFLYYKYTAKKPAEMAPATQPATKPWTPDGKIEEGEYSNHVNLGKMEIYWRTDGEYLYMALKGATKGWVAIGFGPTQAMKDADMVIGWVKDGKATVVDAYSTGVYGPHPPDTKLGGTNDILAFGGSEGEYTIIEFKRKLNTGDKYDKVLEPGKTINIIWAMADQDVFTQKHNVAKGKAEIKI